MWQLMPWDEYRRLAVQEAQRDGFEVVARRLGIGRATLHRWRRELAAERRAA
jgi:transposase-like protein